MADVVIPDRADATSLHTPLVRSPGARHPRSGRARAPLATRQCPHFCNFLREPTHIPSDLFALMTNLRHNRYVRRETPKDDRHHNDDNRSDPP